MSRVHSLLVAAASLFLVVSCAVAPHDGQQLYSNEVTFDGFVRNPGSMVRLEAYDQLPKNFITVTTVRAATTPTFAAGAICPNSPALYRYTGKARLQWPIYWRSLGTTPATYDTRVRATEVTTSGTMPLYFTTDPNAGQCMAANAFNSTCDFYNVATTKCGFTINEATIKGNGSAPWN